MKSGIVVVVLASVIVVAGITYSFIRKNDKPLDTPVPVAVTPNGSSKVVSVDELAKNPEGLRGEFVLRGVVAGVRKDQGVFAVIDSREFESCGVLTCAANTIPVKFDGVLPAPKTIVEITGRVVRGDGGLVIRAKRVEVVK
jgi:hypothetical protein